jgi:vesicle-fusing ATPase
LHIIIFDELDAVFKQRGSTNSGTGVGDTVVNQLLSKMDGVDQLNNILIIGMTNRLDMIDEALLRPGRLEVHMEISLPDEHGRYQILNIHTAKMRNNGVMDGDVDLQELAKLTKNFSGAEIGGLVKSATSFAFNRHVKVGTMAGISDDVENLRVNAGDFSDALDEVHPAFGVSEEELAQVVQNGIIHYDNVVDVRSFSLFSLDMRLTRFIRNYYARASSLLSRCGRQRVLPSSVSSFMGHQAPARRLSQRRSPKRQSFLSLSLSRRTIWSASPKRKRFRRSRRCLRTARRVR